MQGDGVGGVGGQDLTVDRLGLSQTTRSVVLNGKIHRIAWRRVHGRIIVECFAIRKLVFAGSTP